MLVDLNSNIGLRGTPQQLSRLLYSIAAALDAGWTSGQTPMGDWWLDIIDEDYEEEDEG